MRTVDAAPAVSNDLLDLALLLHILDSLSCERTVDFKTIDEDSDGDETV